MVFLTIINKYDITYHEFWTLFLLSMGAAKITAPVIHSLKAMAANLRKEGAFLKLCGMIFLIAAIAVVVLTTIFYSTGGFF